MGRWERIWDALGDWRREFRWAREDLALLPALWRDRHRNMRELCSPAYRAEAERRAARFRGQVNAWNHLGREHGLAGRRAFPVGAFRRPDHSGGTGE